MRGDPEAWPDWPDLRVARPPYEPPQRSTTGALTEAQLRRMMRDGWSHAEICSAWRRCSGGPVSAAAVSAALSRATLTSGRPLRYYETVPWRVVNVHAGEYPVRQLRLLARHRAGIPLPRDSEQDLLRWLLLLRQERVIVAYCPFTDQGFHYLDESMRSGVREDVPIRVQPVRWLEESRERLIDDGRPG